MTETRTGLADRMFDATLARGQAEDQFIDSLEEIVGDHEWWADLTWDWYDRSFELHGVAVGQDLTDEQLVAFAGMGFVQCWLNYTDGTERHYVCGTPARGQIRQGQRRLDRFRIIERALERLERVDGVDRLIVKHAVRALSVIKLTSDACPGDEP
jgi:hypothetical protein